MDEKIKNAFSTIEMPEAAAGKIKERMDAYGPGRKYKKLICPAAVCAVIAAVFLVFPQAASALGDAIKSIRTVFAADPAYYHAGLPMWLEVHGGRLIYVGGGEFTDITDLIDDETPFTAVFTDKRGYENYIAVGGQHLGLTEDPDLNALGWSCWLKKDGKWASGGYGKFKPEAVWCEKAKEELGVPWP